MAFSWWDLGEGSGKWGKELAIYEIACPFCEQRGNFGRIHRSLSQHARSSKVLYFETHQCKNCANFVMVLWSPSSLGKMHDYLLLPWRRRLDEWPEEWPEAVGRLWLQAHRSFNDENWDAAAVMARSSLQAALRERGARRGKLYHEIEDLAGKGLLPPLMVEWSHEVRELGNESAHPNPDDPPTNSDDSRDIVEFLDYALEYLYTMPDRIKRYRSRQSATETPAAQPAEP